VKSEPRTPTSADIKRHDFGRCCPDIHRDARLSEVCISICEFNRWLLLVNAI
jgi:hypothetical protein